MLRESSSSKKVATIEGSFFWKTGGYKKVALQKKVENAECFLSEKLDFSKM